MFEKVDGLPGCLESTVLVALGAAHAATILEQDQFGICGKHVDGAASAHGSVSARLRPCLI